MLTDAQLIKIRSTRSLVYLTHFWGCQMDPSLLTGERAEELAAELVKLADFHGLGVKGRPHIDYFGETPEEEKQHGATINVTLGMKKLKRVEIPLEASGVSYDAWNEGFIEKNGVTYPQVVHQNMHFCEDNETSYTSNYLAYESDCNRLIFKAIEVEREGPLVMRIHKNVP